jgi:NitT/TauT family transport system permease protein
MTALDLSPAHAGLARRLSARRAVPVLVAVLALIALWYAFAVYLNAPRQAEGAGLSFIAGTLSQERPVLPAPHQVAVEIYKTTIEVPPTSRRSLLYHAWVTLSATLLGFAIGTLLGMALAVAIVHVRSLELSLMPWIIASQTVPILAVAPMIIVVLAAIGLTGLLPKAFISTYLSFFPVVVGMVKGFRSPETIQRDLMRTYSATRTQLFWKLRLPASLPFLFVSMKIAIAASLVGAIVGELPTGAVEGIGARLLAGSYYGQTVQIWSALFAAAFMASLLVAAMSLIERITLRLLGQSP